MPDRSTLSDGVFPLIVKLGGSILTRKRETDTLRPKVLTRLAFELHDGWERAGCPPLVVVHGAGSFGHPWARKWSLTLPPKERADSRIRGAAVTGFKVRTLHQAVLKSLLEAGLPAQSLPPLAIAQNREGCLDRLPLEPFLAALDRGSVPVTFGDVVFDLAWGFSVLSGDTLALELARGLASRRVIFVSDVDGLMESGDRPRLIPHLTKDALLRLRVELMAPDVTGGILRKAQRMIEMGELGIHAGLINGLRVGALEEAVTGKDVYGSWS